MQLTSTIQYISLTGFNSIVAASLTSLLVALVLRHILRGGYMGYTGYQGFQGLRRLQRLRGIRGILRAKLQGLLKIGVKGYMGIRKVGLQGYQGWVVISRLLRRAVRRRLTGLMGFQGYYGIRGFVGYTGFQSLLMKFR